MNFFQISSTLWDFSKIPAASPLTAAAAAAAAAAATAAESQPQLGVRYRHVVFTLFNLHKTLPQIRGKKIRFDSKLINSGWQPDIKILIKTKIEFYQNLLKKYPQKLGRLIFKANLESITTEIIFAYIQTTKHLRSKETHSGA